MKTAFAACLLASVSMAFSQDHMAFLDYMIKYGKQYSDMDEYTLRKDLFEIKDLLIRAHNSRPSNFSLGHNKFSDWTKEEMEVLYGDKSSSAESNAYCLPPPSGYKAPSSTPDYVNWAEAGMTTPIKDQGSCGSCWTFATTGTVEAANAIFGSGLVSLAEQELVDCVTVDNGCGGGMTYDAYTYLISHKAYLEDDYPYTATDGTCTYDESKASDISLSSYVCVEPQTPEGMKPAVAQQPVAISIDAGSSVFHNYSGGVLDSEDCGISTNHAVSIVGYGTDSDSGLEYWLVRNSWGESWGDNGYIKIAITEGDGICAINHRPLYPIIA